MSLALSTTGRVVHYCDSDVFNAESDPVSKGLNQLR